MKYLLILLLSIVVYADNYEQKLYDKVLPLLFKQKPIKVYTDEDVREILRDSIMFEIAKHCDESVDLLIGKKFDDLSIACLDKPLFSTNYKTFKRNKNSIGAFYWRKGRPQLKFKKETLQRYSLELPQSLKKFAK